MSLTPHFGPPFSPQLSPALAPIETLEHRQNSSSSESSSRTVMPVTRSYPQENVLAAQDATPLRRYRDSQKHKKTRSRLTGLATPFHVDTRRRPQGVLLPMRLPSRILRSKGHQRLTNVDTSDTRDATSGSAGPVLLMPHVSTSAPLPESYKAMTIPSYVQSQSGGSEEYLRPPDGSLSSPVRFPAGNEPTALSDNEVANKGGPTPTRYKQRNKVAIHEWYRASHTGLGSEHPDEHLGIPGFAESDNDMVDLISNPGSGRDVIDMQVSDTEGNGSLEEEIDTNDVIMEGEEEDSYSGDSEGSSNCGDSSVNSENGDFKGDGTSASSQGPRVISRKRLLSSLAMDIKRIQKQPKNAPSTKGDIQMILDHLHRVVTLEKDQTTHKDSETRSIPGKSIPSPPTDYRTNRKRDQRSQCQCNSHPSGSEVLVKTRIKTKGCQSKNEDPVVYLKVQVTNPTEKKMKK